MDFDSIVSNNIIQDTLEAQADAQGADLDKMPLGSWKALLQEVGAIVFSDREVFKIPHPINPKLNKVYDLKKIDKACDIYLYISNKYNKLISILNFSYFLNIDCDTLYDILNNNKRPQSSIEFSTTRNQIIKKLSRSREECLKDKAFSCSSPVGVIALGNTEFAWNGNGGQIEQGQQKQLAVDSLPTLQAIESH